jgi:hypothetical protein
MDPITIGMLGATVLKAVNDKKREERQRKLQSETTRYSTWTGMTGEAPQEADTMGTLMQGGAGALAQSQAASAAEGTKKLQDAQIKKLGAETAAIESEGMLQGGQPTLMGSTGWKDPKKKKELLAQNYTNAGVME